MMKPTAAPIRRRFIARPCVLPRVDSVPCRVRLVYYWWNSTVTSVAMVATIATMLLAMDE
jgi:hypothetical protein